MMKNVIRFKRDISLRQGMFTSESFAHPAKLDAQLLIWLVEKFTAPGETILDPMFGSGTLMLACALGRNVIGVELEQKFVDMAKKNWEKVRQRPQLGHEMDTCQILQGDARNLSGLLADKVITSPPYSNSPIGGGLATKPPREGHNDTVRSPNSPSQLGAGKYDKIFTSPPYIAQTSTSKQTAHLFEGRQLFKNGRDPQPHSEGQIGNLPYGDIDSIITSPPYGELANEKKNTKSNVSREERLKRAGYDPKEFMGGIARNTSIEEGLRYSHDSNNIGNLPYGSIDSVITLPPYENQIHKGSGEWTKSGVGRLIGGEQSAGGKLLGVPQGEDYIKSAINIGNLRGESYLQAMAQVYQQCHAVLRPGGLMILIVKSFIRKQKIIDLAADTMKLCERAGFTFQERWYRELPAQSFWRILYRRKYPDAPELKFEDVLVFEKLAVKRIEAANAPLL